MVFKFKVELETDAVYEVTYEEWNDLTGGTITKKFLDEYSAREFIIGLDPKNTKVISLIKKISLL